MCHVLPRATPATQKNVAMVLIAARIARCSSNSLRCEQVKKVTHCDMPQILACSVLDFSGVRELDKGISSPIKTIPFSCPLTKNTEKMYLDGKKKI